MEWGAGKDRGEAVKKRAGRWKLVPSLSRRGTPVAPSQGAGEEGRASTEGGIRATMSGEGRAAPRSTVFFYKRCAGRPSQVS